MSTPHRPETREEWDAYHAVNDRSFNIVRFYFRGGRRRIEWGVTLNEARAHCADPETSSSTCTGRVGRARTRRLGAWFDGYESR